MDEKEFEEILTYLSKGKYPETINTKDSRSNWRKKCRPFTYYKTKLYYNHKKYGALLVVKGVKNKKKIIETIHVQSDGQHIGINKTLRKIISNYYWKTIAKDVQNFIKIECSTCIKQVLQQKKQTNINQDADDVSALKSAKKIVDKAIEQIGVDVIGDILEPNVSSTQESSCSAFKCETAAQANIEPLPVILRDHIMAQCGLDVIGPISETHKGKRFIVILTDCVTKWVEAKALNEFTTDSVGDFLAEVMCRHGPLEEILSKYSSDFCTRLTEKLCSVMGVTVQMSNIPPQSNGYIEHYWYNNLLCGALLKYCDLNQYYWDVYLNQVILAYRTFHQKNNAWSPFQLMYDRPTRLPLMGLSQPSSDAYPDEQEALLSHMNNYIKVLSCPTHQQTINVHDRINSTYLPQNTCIINSQQHQSSQVLGSYTQNGPTNNSIPNPNLSIVTSLGPNLQTTVHNTATVPAIPSNSNLTAQAVSANSMTAHTISANTLNTHNMPVNSLGNHTVSTNALPAYTISANSVTNHNASTTNPIITTQAANQVMSQQVSVTQSNAVQAPTHLNDNHSGHMVMIHTDGKTYADSFYVICQQ